MKSRFYCFTFTFFKCNKFHISIIICSGNVIRVNDEKVGSPFTIKAIGSSEFMYGSLSETIKRLNKLGITVEIEKKDDIEISKFNGTIRQEYVKNIE